MECNSKANNFSRIESHTAREIVEGVVNRIDSALKDRNMDLWMKVFYSEDDIANEAQNIWFKGYLIDLNPLQVEFEVLDTEIKNRSIILKSRITFEYENLDKVEELQVYTIEYVDSLKEWCVVWIEKIRKPFMENLEQVEPFSFEGIINIQAGEWWENTELITSVIDSRDELPPEIYARAITRNIRFRETHPVLECVSILSNIMSLQLTQLAAQVFDNNKLQFLANVYNASKDGILVKLVRQDRDNTWASKFLAPWYGFDEMVALRDNKHTISCSCSSYMSFLGAMFRLGGFKTDDVIQIRLLNQDVIVVSLYSDHFLITSGRIDKLTNKTIYHGREVNKVFSDAWFWTSRGATNLRKDASEEYRSILKEKVPIFDFMMPRSINNSIDIFDYEYDLPDLVGVSNSSELNKAIKKRIFELSRIHPKSPFTWAKYGYQTLLVSKPEAYVVWSLQSPIMKSALQKWTSTDEFFSAISNFQNQSIFPEKDRIMTADQVVRYRMGDIKSKAILLFTWFKLKEDKNGFILFTDKGCYCIWANGNGWEVLDVKSFERRDSPRGKILLAFDDKYSYYPLIKKENANEDIPVWLSELNNL